MELTHLDTLQLAVRFQTVSPYAFVIKRLSLKNISLVFNTMSYFPYKARIAIFSIIETSSTEKPTTSKEVATEAGLEGIFATSFCNFTNSFYISNNE